jgi:hypothetical protein
VTEIVDMKSSEVFRAGAQFLETHDWAKGAFARNNEGVPVLASDEDATCFCAIGAMMRATTYDLGLNADRNYSYLTVRDHTLDIISLPKFNDHIARTKEDVISHMYATASRLEARGW